MLFKSKKILAMEDEIDRLTNEVAITTIMIEARNERIEKLTDEIKTLSELYERNCELGKNLLMKEGNMKRERDHFKALYESLQARFDYLDRAEI